MLIFSVLINVPFGFMYYPALTQVSVGDELVNFYYWGLTDFTLSNYGKVVTYLVYFVRDFSFLLIKIVINVYSVYVVRQYLTRISMCTFTVSNVDVINNSDEDSVEINQKISKKGYVTQTDRNLTYMSICMCFLSVLENVFYTFAYMYYSIIDANEGSLIVFFLSYFTLALKHASNIFVLYFFNNSFKDEFKRIFFIFC